MFGFLKKEYEIVILNQKLKYDQLSYYECIEFLREITKENFDIVDWVYEFLSKKISIQKQDLLKIKIDDFFELYKDTACKGFFDKKQNKESENISTFESYICFLSKELNIDPLSLLKEYTPEQLNLISEGVIFNLNEMTKEGQRKNRMKNIHNKNNIDNKNQNEKDLEYIKKQREKRENLKNNKK